MEHKEVQSSIKNETQEDKVICIVERHIQLTMAKMFKYSEDVYVKQLSIFETPPTNTSVREKRFLNFHPISTIKPSSNVIHSSIKGQSLRYVDLQKSWLYIWCKI